MFTNARRKDKKMKKFTWPVTDFQYKKGQPFQIIPSYKYSLYRIYGKEGKLLYIGVTTGLKERIRTHFNGYSNMKKYHKEFNNVLVTELTDLNSYNYEIFLITLLKPLYNNKKGLPNG